MRRSFITLSVACLLLTAAGCGSVDYYRQALGGHFELLAKRLPVADLIADPATPAELRGRLVLARELLAFAGNELGLDAGGSYADYTALGRRYAVWNVFAAPSLSLQPHEWCYPLVGCLAYRGYFDRERAEAEAARLAATGADVHVGGVAAYSTLGWFDDPLLDTFLSRRDDRLADLLFHELAHRRLFVSGDTEFNESFATAVADAGVARWLAAHHDRATATQRRHERAWTRRVMARLRATRESLAVLYASGRPAAELEAAKKAALARLQADVVALGAVPGARAGLVAWVGEGMNNAKLNAVGVYHRWVPAFMALLARHDGDLPTFYAAVERLGGLPMAERRATLAALEPGAE